MYSQDLYIDNESLVKKLKEIQSTKETAELLKKKKQELTKIVGNLTESKIEIEGKFSKIKDSVKQIFPNTPIEIENSIENYSNLIRKISLALNLNPNIIDSTDFINAIEQKLEQAKNDLENADNFKRNKQKFVELYEKNTIKLQDEWNLLKTQKEEFALEKSRIENIILDKKFLDDQMKQLVSTSKELKKVKNNLEKEKSALEASVNNIKQSISILEGLKQKEMNEYHRLQGLNEKEMQKYEEIILELKGLKMQIKGANEEREQVEGILANARKEISIIEERKMALDDEIREGEGALYRLINRTSDEQIQTLKELETAKKLIKAKEKEIESFNSIAKNYEMQISKASEETEIALSKIDMINDEIQTKDLILAEKTTQLNEIEPKLSSYQSSLEKITKEFDLLTQNLTEKKQTLASIETEFNSKSSELTKIAIKKEQELNNLNLIEKQVGRIKNDLLGIEQVVIQKNKDYDNLCTNHKLKSQDMKNLEKDYNDKYLMISKAEQRLSDIQLATKSEEESIRVFREESKSLHSKISKLTETLKRVKAQKHSVLQEIEKINLQLIEEENRHRKELESLNKAVSNGENTLRQLMDSIQRCRNKLSSDKEQMEKIADELNKLKIEKENLESINGNLIAESVKIREEICGLKVEEDTAMVLLALSGHKVDDRIRQRISYICRAAKELGDFTTEIPTNPFEQ
ncbi:hypothetical protein SteCoe_29187 [Stentor coeruleus]|uniref:Uncharacterized protein n=1 Tax=Stentor coeruleus TaxID=5963 RepID=A0A1R2B6G3_9CILI|nr:hypothetical protein SteCoe_29187 [Stentor coeruleus]